MDDDKKTEDQKEVQNTTAPEDKAVVTPPAEEIKEEKPAEAKPEDAKPEILPPNTAMAEMPMDEYLDPVRVNRMYTLASVYFRAKCFTKDCQNVEQVFVKLQAGRELGLKPMEAMNDLYLLYGHTTFWGAGLAKRFRRFGYEIEYKDEVSNYDYKSSKGQKASHQLPPDPSAIPTIDHAKLDPSREDRVTVLVTSMKDPNKTYEYKVTLSEVEVLNSSALKISRKDKLRWHGLARIARFYLPEILGSIHYIAEEITPDMAVDNIEAGKDKKQALRDKGAGGAGQFYGAGGVGRAG